ncbi:MAG: hypothetical protein H3C43_04290 [Leptonema sp. (in: Bacteria)]|nr:hypothetical protein [Leptonema sp. (in: bacteria)]
MISVVYYLGGDRVWLIGSGSAIHFDKDKDWYLYDIGHGYALSKRADDTEGWYRLVKPEKSLPPFCYICGYWNTGKEIFPLIAYKKGDWVYPSITVKDEIAALNVVTGETIMSQRQDPYNPDNPDHWPAKIEHEPAFVKHGFSFDEQFKASIFDIEKLIKEPLSSNRDSCNLFHLAFWTVFVLLAIVGLIGGLILKLKS